MGGGCNQGVGIWQPGPDPHGAVFDGVDTACIRHAAAGGSGHPEVKLDAPQFVGFSAILEAQRRVAGEDSDRNEMETIGACAFAGWCGIRPSYVPNSDEGKALWENVVEQYAAALRANDVKAILAVKPS